ncbi:MAG: Bax inhibitor-1 family protein [Fimbriimonadales bacterium]
MSFPIPSPYFPEPIRIAGNVEDAGYRHVVRFSRVTALTALLLMAVMVAAVAFWMEPARTEWPLSLGPERIWLAALCSFILLAFARRSPLIIQLPLFALFAFGVSATFALWAPTIAEDFPDFAKALGWTFASGWAALVLFNLAAWRDYSFLGQYLLVWLATVLSTTVFTVMSDIVFSLAFASLVVFSAALYYFVYDLSMILKRRAPEQTLQGALDLYRDTLNFVGYPVRVMRMPRGLRRNRE